LLTEFIEAMTLAMLIHNSDCVLAMTLAMLIHNSDCVLDLSESRICKVQDYRGLSSTLYIHQHPKACHCHGNCL